MTLEELERSLAQPRFAALDRHFARFIQRASGVGDGRVGLAAALVSQARGAGHLCLELPAMAGKSLAPSDEGEADTEGILLPSLDEWIAVLRQAASVVGVPGGAQPLILTPEGRLYLARYWDYERRVAGELRSRAQATLPIGDPQKLAAGLSNSGPAPGNEARTDWQQVAVYAALRKRLCVITGGPGTGKTTTVAKVLRQLFEQEPAARVALAAPTGKAAARMKESLVASQFPVERLVGEPGTVHRLLESLPGSPFFRHDSQRPLALDLLVIDEASMMDVGLLAKVFEALPKEARLILVGDKDQLASVEAGSVLGDLCAASPPNWFTEAFRQEFGTLAGNAAPPASGPGLEAPLRDSVVQLVERYRAGPASPIYPVSDAVISGDFPGFQAAVEASGGTVQSRLLPGARELRTALGPRLREGFKSVLGSTEGHDPLKCLRRFQVLCAVRRGPYGVEGLNRLTETVLREAGLIGRPRSVFDEWYHGRLVLVTVNDPQLGLFNGDVGIVLADAEGGRLDVCFPGSRGGEVRRVAPVRLPKVETAFALTVHKSQGSEFDHVLVVLPDRMSPVLTRELVYTAITRARQSVEVWAPEAVLREAMESRVERTSGLQQALGGQGSA